MIAKKKGKKRYLLIGIVLIIIIINLASNPKDSTVQGNPFEVFKIKKVDVMNGSGTNKIGERGYIETDINSFDDVSLDELKKYCDEVIEKDSYNWFSVYLKDGTGFCFIGGVDDIAVSFGVMDEEGRVISEEKPHEEFRVTADGKGYEKVPEEETKTDLLTPETKRIESGHYAVGKDIEPGEYKLFADFGKSAYLSLNKDSSGSFESIVANENFDNFTYIRVKEGQYLEIQRGYAVLADQAEKYSPINGTYIDGMYKVGVDIPAGEYNVQAIEGMLGYLEVATAPNAGLDSIITNDNFENNKIITVKEGQYLKINRAYIKI